MLAVMGNRVYRIREEEAEARRDAGYDICDDAGRLVRYSSRKTVPYEKYAALLAEAEKRGAKKKE